MSPNLPQRELTQIQAAELSGLRSRMLRRVGIAQRGPVLDLGAGHGDVTRELIRRARGPVIAFDRRAEPMTGLERAVVGDATALPFAPHFFDVVFAQCFFLHNPDPDPIIRELMRVLGMEGVILCIEPDYGGLIEYPQAIALGPVWHAALTRSGADPLVARRLPSRFARAGLSVRVDLFSAPAEPKTSRFALLEGLPLSASERRAVNVAKQRDAELSQDDKFVHLPFFGITAKHRSL